ncbi:MAG: ATP-dependent sacrificial sulfur transferase LarE, partial [Actinomycetes bacterium]
VVVAFSGGADSAFLAWVAHDTLGGERALAMTAVSPSLAGDERRECAALAAEWGLSWCEVSTDEMAEAAYRANDGDRCYFCKAELLDVLGPLADRHGLAAVATGTNADDAVAGFRPGIRAAAERHAATPLLDAGLTKEQVRRASRGWRLVTWDKPAAACLSSRVAYGLEITPSRLGRIERAEAALRESLAAAAIPVSNLRVRDLGDRARVEVDPDVVDLVARSSPVIESVRAVGFDEVEVDARGFRSGAMNELLTEPRRYR